jgi:hypothetical protein
MRTKCYSVRLHGLTYISDKCYKAVAFDGSEDLIPASQVFGRDYDVQKSDAWWITAWILKKKNIQYSDKKEAWFDQDTGNMLPTYHIEKHIPNKIENINVEPIKELIR